MDNIKIIDLKNTNSYEGVNVIGLNGAGEAYTVPSYVAAWDGESTPDVTLIPEGVVVTYNGTNYTGTLVAERSIADNIYLVASATQQGQYDRYVVSKVDGEYTWVNIGSTAIDVSFKADKDTDAVEGNVAKFDSNGNPVDSGIASDNVAQQDGYYSSMTVGLAENLVDTKGSGTEQEITFRTSCGSESISDDGVGVIQNIEGKSLVWNQFTKNGNFANVSEWAFVGGTYTVNDNVATFTSSSAGSVGLYKSHPEFVEGHKYLYLATCLKHGGSNVRLSTNQTQPDATMVTLTEDDKWQRISTLFTLTNKSSIQQQVWMQNASVGDYFQAKDVISIDLTLMFGAGNEPSTVEEFEALFPLPYYPYDAGTIISNVATGLKTVGFNLYNPSDGTANLLGGQTDGYQITGTYTSLSFTGDSGTTSTINPDSNGLFNVDENGVLTVTGGNSTDTCVHLCWSGYRNGEYEPYWTETRALPITTITGKLSGSQTSVTIFPEGLKSAGTVHDELGTTTATKRIGKVDMGDLSWGYSSDTLRFYAPLPSGAAAYVGAYSTDKDTYLCSKYAKSVALSGLTDKHICLANNTYVYVMDSNHTDAATFKTAMSGVYLYYELATPEEYTLDSAWNNAYRVADFGTEEIVPLVDANGEPAMAVPFTATIKYQDDFTREIANLPENYQRRDELKQVPGTDTTNAMSQKGVGDYYAEKSGTYPSMVVGSAQNLVGRGSVEAEYTFRTSGGTADIGSGTAEIAALKGNSVVWNQLVKDYSDSTNLIATGDSTISYSDGKINISIVGTSSVGSVGIKTGAFVAGHKYRTLINYTGINPAHLKYGSESSVTDAGDTTIIANTIRTQTSSSHNNQGAIWFWGTEGDLVISSIKIIDLTLMFGSGNEPSTVDEFDALFPLPYYAYNAGEIINNEATTIQTVGFNQWDEEWEVGNINTNTGEDTTTSSSMRSKGYIDVFPSTVYHFQSMAAESDSLKYCDKMCFYDADKVFISTQSIINNGTVITTPSNARYARFVMRPAYGTTYNNDICLNLSWSGWRNGEYEAYWKSQLALNIPTLTGKLNGEGSSVTICADGLKSAGSVYDEGVVENGYLTKIIKRVGTVDLGTLTWALTSGTTYSKFTTELTAVKSINYNIMPDLLNTKYVIHTYTEVGSGNVLDKVLTQNAKYLAIMDSDYTAAATFTTAMSGVMLNYALATEETYVLDTPFYVGYRVDDFGTEERLPADTSSAVTAPIRYSVKYALNAADTIRRLGTNYIKKESMDAILTALQTAGIIASYTLTYDSTNDDYDCIITAPSE